MRGGQDTTTALRFYKFPSLQMPGPFSFVSSFERKFKLCLLLIQLKKDGDYFRSVALRRKRTKGETRQKKGKRGYFEKKNNEAL